MQTREKIQNWASSHSWAYALLTFLIVPSCFFLIQISLHKEEVMNDPLKIILMGVIAGWIGAILIIIRNKVQAPIAAKVILALLTCIPPYVIYSHIYYKNRLMYKPFLDFFVLAIIVGLIVIILIIFGERGKITNK